GGSSGSGDLGMEHFRFEPEDFRFPLNRGIVLFVCYRVFSYAKPLRTLAGNGVFWRIVLCKGGLHLCWKYFRSSHCSALSRFALLLDMHSRVAFRYAKPLRALAGNDVLWRIVLCKAALHLCWKCFRSSQCPSQSRVALLQDMHSRVAFRYAKLFRAFAGNAVFWGVFLSRSASHLLKKLSLVALSDAKPLCTFAGNALDVSISLRKTA